MQCPLGTLSRIAFTVMRRKIAKLKEEYLRAEGNRHTDNYGNMRNKLAALCWHHIRSFSAPWSINLTDFIFLTLLS